MSYTHGLRTTWTDGAATLGANVEQTNEGQITHNVTLAASASLVEVTVAFTQAQLRSIFILSNLTVTMRTNSSSSPVETITIQANKPFTWQFAGYGTIPFSAAGVTRLFFSNADSVSSASVNIRVLIDATP